MTLPADERPYRGRFAPTPSGPLHRGSMLTALASWLQARSRRGHWLLRIDDLDTPRCVPGAAEQILRQLEAHGLLWDEAPRYQSQHVDEYHAAIKRLVESGFTYHCTCTRTMLAATSRPGPDGAVYAGTCRGLRLARGALRVQVAEGSICIEDQWQGRQCRNLGSEVGDIAIQRADGQVSYQLACAIDEAAQEITEVARGIDLLGSTFRQVHLQEKLGLVPSRYRHLPIVVDNAGRKLSKQNHAPAVEAAEASRLLVDLLGLLQQEPPANLAAATTAEILGWAVAHWQPLKLCGLRVLQVE